MNPRDKSEQWKHLSMSRQTLGENRYLANRYICALLGAKPRLHDWWNVIAKNDREE